MNNKLFDFIITNKQYVVTDVAKRLTLKFDIPVKTIDDFNFPDDNEIVQYSFIYKDDDIDASNISEFVNIFKQNNYLKVSEHVTVFMTIKKNLVKTENINNFYFFMSNENFFKAINDIKIKNSQKKLLVLLLGEKSSFTSPFIDVVPIENFAKDVSDQIEISELTTLKHLNSVFKDKELKNFLYYPIAWLSTGKNETSNLYNKHLLITFLSIICNSKENNTYLIRGYKTIYINIAYEVDLSHEACEKIVTLLRFIIDEQRGHDKLLILRNTMSLFLDNEGDASGFERKIDEILKNVKFNFNLYVQNKVEIFLNQKNKILQEYINTAKKIEDLTNALIAQSRTVFLSLLGTFFLSLLKDISKIESSPVINLILLGYIFYFVFNIVAIQIQVRQKDSLINSLKEYTQELGVSIQNNEENFSFDNLEQKYLKKSVDLFEKYCFGMKLTLIIAIVFFLILYVSNRFGCFSFIKDILRFVIAPE